jgi:cytidine deaminase
MNFSEQLIEAATAAREMAYAPYSGYAVGAAILDADDRVWSGCNVENISFGLTVCAERAAICKMVSEGGRRIQAITVVTRDGGTPCGMCLQSILEFADDPQRVDVFTVSVSGIRNHYKLCDLMPHGFHTEDLHRT